MKFEILHLDGRNGKGLLFIPQMFLATTATTLTPMIGFDYMFVYMNAFVSRRVYRHLKTLCSLHC